jgi:3'(2'), 5'-bisphosphate nucleotidase
MGLLPLAIDAAKEAGREILRVYASDFAVTHKDDRSPVTAADHAAQDVILARLAATGIPVVSEEHPLPDTAAPRFWLVDPLDGTKEFVRGGDDYTVNIGLIVGGKPHLGAVYAPATEQLHAGLVGEGAWLEDLSNRIPISTRKPGKEIVAVASKSHFNQPTADYLAKAAGECAYVAIGSSLKFCIVAEGRADIYPRLSPTSEWDTAAGHAVLLAAGGRVDGTDGKPLAYGKRAFLNRGFVATSGFEAPSIGPFLEPFSGGGELPQGV